MSRLVCLSAGPSWLPDFALLCPPSHQSGLCVEPALSLRVTWGPRLTGKREQMRDHGETSEGPRTLRAGGRGQRVREVWGLWV